MDNFGYSRLCITYAVPACPLGVVLLLRHSQKGDLPRDVVCSPVEEALPAVIVAVGQKQPGQTFQASSGFTVPAANKRLLNC